ncbi:MAG TPA: hypothetical protein VE974_11595 [Thermoanaerobaculia bacterium]|nr:hypothetical protein [Thermoanaerobaculia bacterium]
MRVTDGVQLEHGLAVVAAERAGRSVAGEVIAFHGAAVSKRGRATVFESDDAASIRFAFYGSEVLANGWQPYDQPNPAAYIPLGYEALDRYDTDCGAILVEHRRQHRQLWRELVEEEPHFVYALSSTWSEAAKFIEALARRNGVSADHAAALAARIHERLLATDSM